MKIKLLSFLMALFCANFALAQDPVLDCAAMGNGDGTVCAAGLAAFSAALDMAAPACGLANTEYVISDPTMTIDPDATPGTGDEGFAVLGASDTPAFDPTAYGVTGVGDEFCVTAVCYDLSQLQSLIDAIYGNSSIPILSCCALVESQFAGLCADLMAAGINSGADITSLQDVITVAGVFSGGAVTLESVVGVIGTLNANLGTLGGVGCDGGVTNIDYMIDGVDEATNTGTGVTCCFTVIADTEAACMACAVAADLAVAPAPPTVTESVCGADGVTLEGGVVDPITCPAGSTAEYSLDGGTTWVAAVPAYDQTTAITVTVRCLCDEDMATASPTAEVTTVPGMCTTPVDCGIAAGEPAMATADVCLQDIGTVDVTGIFGDPGPAGTPSLVQNYAVTDMATGDLITISNSATLDLTGAQVGTVACVTAIAYTQETLDVITAAIDNVTQIPLSPIPPLGMLDLSGFLNGLNGAFEVVGVEFTAADIQMWCETQTLTIPFSQLPGGLIPDLTLDLMTLIPPSGFCCDFSNSDYCLTVIDCSTPCDPATCNNVTVTITSAMLDTSDPGFDEGFPGDNTIETVFVINGVQFFADVDVSSGAVEAVTLTPCAGNTFVVGPTSICADAPPVTVDMLVFDDDDAGDGRCDPFDPDAGLFGAEGDDEIWPDNSGANPGAAGSIPFDLTATSFTGGPITIEYTVSCEAVTCDPCPACDPLVSTTTAPPAVVASESTCEADGMTLSGGVIDPPATACPTGSTLEYSIDAGTTWSTTLPTYDQTTAVTVDTRCVCDSDATDISATASVTTVPGMCMAVCEADAPELDPATGDCAADDGDMMETPFTWPVNAASTENTTAPYITEYIVTDAASGTIIGVFPTLAAAEAAANTEITTDADGNATACIQPINHDSANLEAVIADIDAQSNGLICGVLPCPVTTLEAFYTAAAGLGAALDVATVVGIIGPPNVGATGLDLGAALGLPPGALVVDVPPFCYELGAEVCATNAACPAMCDPTLATSTAPAAQVTSESTCEADGVTLSGGVIAAPAAACPAGSTLEYSTDGGATWSTVLPTYDQANAITVDTRCVCDIDANIVSMTASVTTVPGMCTGGGVCSISVNISNFACDDGGTPDDASDDMVTFDYTVVDNGGTGTTWSSDQGDAGAAYGTSVAVGPILADGSTWTINVTDDGDATCTASASQVLSDCATVDNIPTVGEWGLIMLGLLMTITAVVGIRQRREEEVYS